MAEPPEQKPPTAPTIEPRRRRSSTGRFRDRTLNWFKSGDDIDPDAVPSGEYAPAPPGRPVWVVPAVAGAVVVIVVIVIVSVV